ncbi:ROK family glucokinase [Halobacillus amylolyticus]|uniref:Glucokinase n=1 Tax=Halobacillus amylolyticus TaxID=2932259 RepID=A0ABY4HEH6_9BACI|nr:ROK family glucokinase [Halobacillus amylolyticus]UOR12315.1 ROK family glucokinase [Halobacillus amylolyticus]
MSENYCFGVDVGGTTIKLAVLSTKGDILKKWEIPTNKSEQGRYIPQDIHKTIDSAQTELALHKSNVLGIGVGAPGFVDTKTGYIYEAVNIGWKNFDFGKQLANLSGYPVWVDNDANLAALGENWLGAGGGVENLIAVTLGTGVGGGIIANGKIISGANGMAAEIGHMTVIRSGGAACNCGKSGCLETETSATGIVRKAKEVLSEYPSSSLNSFTSITAKDVFQAAADHDEAASKVIASVIDTLGLTIANLAIAINPNKIVIGGGVSKAGVQLLQPLKEAFRTYALTRTAEACTFEIAELGNDAGVIGGAYLVKENL